MLYKIHKLPPCYLPRVANCFEMGDLERLIASYLNETFCNSFGFSQHAHAEFFNFDNDLFGTFSIVIISKSRQVDTTKKKCEWIESIFYEVKNSDEIMRGEMDTVVLKVKKVNCYDITNYSYWFNQKN